MMSKSRSKEKVLPSSPISPGTLYLVHDDRAREEVSITLWFNSDYGTIASGRITPGDTLMIIKARSEKSGNLSVWDVISKGRLGFIYVDRDSLINFRRISWIDE